MNSYKDGNSMGAKLGWQHRLGRAIGGKVGASVGASMGASAGASVGAAVGVVGGPPGSFIGGAVGGLAGGVFGAKHGQRIGERVGHSAVSRLGTLKGMNKKFLIASAAKIRENILGKLSTTKTKESHMNTYKAGNSASVKKAWETRRRGGGMANTPLDKVSPVAQSVGAKPAGFKLSGRQKLAIGGAIVGAALLGRHLYRNSDAGKSARYAGGLKSGHNRWKVGQALRGNQKRGFGDYLNTEQGKNYSFRLMDSLRKAARITLSYKAEVELISWTL